MGRVPGEPAKNADPKGSVAGGEQGANVAAGKTLTRWRLPGDHSNAVKAKQPELRAEPEIPVRRLSE